MATSSKNRLFMLIASLLATLPLSVVSGRTLATVRAASVSPSQLKEQLKAEVAAGQAQGGIDYMNATRQRLGLPPVTIVHGPPPAGGMSQPRVAGYGQAPPGQVTAGPGTTAASVQPQPLSSGYSGGWYWVSMNKWIEADGGYGGSCTGANGYSDPRSSHSLSWYANLCGPGSSEAVISNWNNNPNTYSGWYYYGYVASQGLHWLGYFLTVANEEMAYSQCPENAGQGSSWGTCDQTEANIINHEVGVSWYSVYWCAGSVANPYCSTPNFSNWKNDVTTDVEYAGVPLVDEVLTCDTLQTQCLPGWPYRADHFQAISQYDPTDALDKYGETGNADDACQGGYAPGAYTNSSWQDPITGAYFNQQWGWDYVSNSFDWQRSRTLIW